MKVSTVRVPKMGHMCSITNLHSLNRVSADAACRPRTLDPSSTKGPKAYPRRAMSLSLRSRTLIAAKPCQELPGRSWHIASASEADDCAEAQTRACQPCTLAAVCVRLASLTTHKTAAKSKT